MPRSSWSVYMVCCVDGSFYTGITNDLKRRMNEHNNNDKLAASYTRSRRPVRLVYQETYPDRSSATRRELEIKRMTRQEKETLSG